MPPMSYIDANAFETVEDLANHLKYLSDHPEQIVKYFWWKEHYEIRKRPQTIKGQQLCKICEKLNEPNLFEKTQYYRDIKRWNGEGICREPNIKF
jgi:alpha-1,3-fucosyltransferase